MDGRTAFVERPLVRVRREVPNWKAGGRGQVRRRIEKREQWNSAVCRRGVLAMAGAAQFLQNLPSRGCFSQPSSVSVCGSPLWGLVALGRDGWMPRLQIACVLVVHL